MLDDNVRRLLGSLRRHTMDELRILRRMGYGEEGKDIYIDYQGYGYKTTEDRDAGRNKMAQDESDKKYYPQQYGT